jgi:hypothetical protein
MYCTNLIIRWKDKVYSSTLIFKDHSEPVLHFLCLSTLFLCAKMKEFIVICYTVKNKFNKNIIADFLPNFLSFCAIVEFFSRVD